MRLDKYGQPYQLDRGNVTRDSRGVIRVDGKTIPHWPGFFQTLAWFVGLGGLAYWLFGGGGL